MQEYEKCRRQVAHGGGTVRIKELPKLREFFDREDPAAFRAGTSTRFQAALDQLRAALLRPLELPTDPDLPGADDPPP